MQAIIGVINQIIKIKHGALSHIIFTNGTPDFNLKDEEFHEFEITNPTATPVEIFTRQADPKLGETKAIKEQKKRAIHKSLMVKCRKLGTNMQGSTQSQPHCSEP